MTAEPVRSGPDQPEGPGEMLLTLLANERKKSAALEAKAADRGRIIADLEQALAATR